MPVFPQVLVYLPHLNSNNNASANAAVANANNNKRRHTKRNDIGASNAWPFAVSVDGRNIYSTAPPSHSYKFDGVLASPKAVYESHLRRPLSHFVDGYNTCVLSLGSFRLGKSLLCDPVSTDIDTCVLQQLAHDLFQSLTTRSSSSREFVYKVSLQLFSIRNELVYDRLNHEAEGMYLDESTERGAFVSNAVLHPVDSAREVWFLLEQVKDDPVVTDVISTMTICVVPDTFLRQTSDLSFKSARMLMSALRLSSSDSTPNTEKNQNMDTESTLTSLLSPYLLGNATMTLIFCLRPEKHTPETTHTVLSMLESIRERLCCPLKMTDGVRMWTERWRKVVDGWKVRIKILEKTSGTSAKLVKSTKQGTEKEEEGEGEGAVSLRHENKIRQMREQIDYMTAQNSNLRATLDGRDMLVSSLRDENERLRTTVNTLQYDLDAVTTEKEQSTNALRSKLVTLEEESERLRRKVNVYETTEEESKRRVEEAESHHDAMKMELDVVQKNFALLRRDYEDEVKRGETISVELLASVHEKADLVKENDRVKIEVESFKAECKRYKALLSEQTAEVGPEGSTIHMLRLELEDTKQRLLQASEQHDRRLSKLHDENARLQELLVTQSASQSADTHALHVSHREEIERLLKQMGELQKECTEQKRKLTDLTTILRERSVREREMDDYVRRTRDELVGLEERLHSVVNAYRTSVLDLTKASSTAQNGINEFGAEDVMKKTMDAVLMSYKTHEADTQRFVMAMRRDLDGLNNRLTQLMERYMNILEKYLVEIITPNTASNSQNATSSGLSGVDGLKERVERELDDARVQLHELQDAINRYRTSVPTTVKIEQVAPLLQQQVPIPQPPPQVQVQPPPPIQQPFQQPIQPVPQPIQLTQSPPIQVKEEVKKVHVRRKQPKLTPTSHSKPLPFPSARQLNVPEHLPADMVRVLQPILAGAFKMWESERASLLRRCIVSEKRCEVLLRKLENIET